MTIAIVSYSNSGNNTQLAERVAAELHAKHIRVQAKTPFSYGTVIADFLLFREPEIDISAKDLSGFDLILFFAPIWMGMVAFPLRRCLRFVKKHPVPYGFFSISGGALGDNPKLSRELTRRTSAKPVLVLDQHITSLLPADPPPTSKDTSAYLLSDADCERLATRVLAELNKAVPTAF